MNNKIQIRRSPGSSNPTGLLAGELAWSDNNPVTGAGGETNGYLYIGDVRSTANGGTAIHKIGGPGWGLDLLDSTTLTTGLSSPSLDASPTQLDGSLKIATTSYVDTAVTNATPAMNDISDATIANEADADLIIWNDSNSAWENKPLGGHITITAAGVANVGNVQDGIVTLGTKTSGAYVETLTAGDNIVITGQGGESANATISLAQDVVVAGTLTVSGTTTTVSSSTVSVVDPVFIVGDDTLGDTTDRGISFKWNDDDTTANGGLGNERVGFFGYDKSDGKFKYIEDSSNTSEVFTSRTGVLGNAAFAEIDGTLQTASQTNVTELGTITVGTWNGTKIQNTHGGTGIDTSLGNGNDDGVATVSSGTWSVEANLDVGFGGTGLSTIETNALLVGNGAGNMGVLSTLNSNGKILRVESGVATWSDTIDAGTF